MSAFPNWQKYAVNQRRLQTGCIPTGYEIILRAANVSGVDFVTFQDEFDLDKNGIPPPKNHFDPIAKAIQKRYPHIEFVCESFAKGKGQEKVQRIEEFIIQQKPLLVSISNAPFGMPGWHIMLVVDATSYEFTLLEYVDINGTPHTKNLKKADVAEIHDKYQGGEEIAYLKESTLPSAI